MEVVQKLKFPNNSNIRKFTTEGCCPNGQRELHGGRDFLFEPESFIRKNKINAGCFSHAQIFKNKNRFRPA